MSVRLGLKYKALEDIAAAHHWYEERRLGWGAVFEAEVIACCRYIVQAPQGFPRAYGSFRRIGLKRFPYVMIYRVIGEEVIVFRVLHGHRDREKLMRPRRSSK